MAHGIIQLDAISAQLDVALNRNAKAAYALDNGNVFQLLTKSATAGEGEVWNATAVAATAGLTHLWMAAEPVQVVTVGAFKNIDVDPRNFEIAAGKVFSAFKPQVGDIITLSADALGGTKASNGFVVATAAEKALQWGAAAVSGLSLKLLGDSYISVADGSIGKQRVTAYQFEVVAIA